MDVDHDRLGAFERAGGDELDCSSADLERLVALDGFGIERYILGPRLLDRYLVALVDVARFKVFDLDVVAAMGAFEDFRIVEQVVLVGREATRRRRRRARSASAPSRSSGCSRRGRMC
jgi:hypothetical protein